MKKLESIIFFDVLLVGSILSAYNQNELQITLDLIQEFSIRQCIFVSDDNNLLPEIKAFSFKNIPSTYLTFNQIIKYVNITNTLHYHVGIIFKEKDTLQLELISNILEKLVSTSWKRFCVRKSKQTIATEK